MHRSRDADKSGRRDLRRSAVTWAIPAVTGGGDQGVPPAVNRRRSRTA